MIARLAYRVGTVLTVVPLGCMIPSPKPTSLQGVAVAP